MAVSIVLAEAVAVAAAAAVGRMEAFAFDSPLYYTVAGEGACRCREEAFLHRKHAATAAVGRFAFLAGRFSNAVRCRTIDCRNRHSDRYCHYVGDSLFFGRHSSPLVVVVLLFVSTAAAAAVAAAVVSDIDIYSLPPLPLLCVPCLCRRHHCYYCDLGGCEINWRRHYFCFPWDFSPS